MFFDHICGSVMRNAQREVTLVVTDSSLRQSQDSENRLASFGLSTDLIHTALKPGLTRASNRTSLALPNSAGTDVYHDSMEQFHYLLSNDGWRVVSVRRQPRLLHPEQLIAFTVSSGKNVANPNRKIMPRTGPKGVATRSSLSEPRSQTGALFDLFDDAYDEELAAAAEDAPFWMLVYERTSYGLNLELSQPTGMTESGTINEWADRIIIDPLETLGDLSVFVQPDDDFIDVSIEPR